MGFLHRVKAASKDQEFRIVAGKLVRISQGTPVKVQNETTISLEDIYSEDPQFKELVDLVIDLLIKFANKFKLNEKSVVDLFIKKIRKDL